MQDFLNTTGLAGRITEAQAWSCLVGMLATILSGLGGWCAARAGRALCRALAPRLSEIDQAVLAQLALAGADLQDDIRPARTITVDALVKAGCCVIYVRDCAGGWQAGDIELNSRPITAHLSRRGRKRVWRQAQAIRRRVLAERAEAQRLALLHELRPAEILAPAPSAIHKVYRARNSFGQMQVEIPAGYELVKMEAVE